MQTQISKYWELVRASLWFVPSVLVGLSALAAFGFVRLDETLGAQSVDDIPFVLGAGPDGARGMLTAIANSVLGLTGVTFSITIVVLSLAASQYSPRILRNFMADRGNQIVLGGLLGTFVYALLVLRSVRSGEQEFVPSLALTVAFVFALTSLGLFIYFIDHIATSIQASTIADDIAKATTRAVDRMFPQGAGIPSDDVEEEPVELPEGEPIHSHTSGYIQSVDTDGLIELLEKHDLALTMERGVGEFIVQGRPLATLSSHGEADHRCIKEIRALYAVGKERTLQQDIEFGVRQLVDIALKALSPGINDPTTAVNCIDHLGAVLARLVGREIPPRRRYDESGRLRLIARGTSFPLLMDLAFDQIRAVGNNYPDVLDRLLAVLEDLSGTTQGTARRLALLEHANRITRAADRELEEESGRQMINSRLERVGRLLSDVGVVHLVPPTPRVVAGTEGSAISAK